MDKIHILLLALLLASVALHAQEKAPVMPSVSTAGDSVCIDRAELVAFARQYLGTPYRRAGASPKNGFDCSGFVRFIFGHFNYTLPRSSVDYKALGAGLKPENFRVGDILVFYGYRDKKRIGHVGIVCEANGMKSRFIHASSGKAKSVTISDLDSPGYRKRFYKCIDVIR